ncbi:MAG: hypothetical protein DRQ60_08495 [Gammaproteobacteria bacterium]|nr:MAG: hypothetical protein DRQ54_03430 [Gammaproteobacteria bacterium]RLA11095.1 MAG: hypothetical protein DRQ52_10245 [Gammaproteobacteria bacterium]RLA12604.1 MAG: hypothetical protein DRQ60_08495 [Gammaproteobacteria bacterium]
MTDYQVGLTVPLLLVATSAAAAEPQSYQVAFVHDYQQQGDAKKLHRLVSQQVQFDADGVLAGFTDSQGPLSWNASTYDSGQHTSLHWGRWTRGIIGGTGLHSGQDISGAEGVRNSFRYIAGVVPNMPLTDAATYSLLGGHTGPTAGEGGGTSITLLNQGQVELTDGGDFASVSLSLRVASGIYNFSSPKLPVKAFGFSADQPIPTSGVLCIPGCTTYIEGFVAGAEGAEVGVAFSIHNPALSKHINGIAAFQRD